MCGILDEVVTWTPVKGTLIDHQIVRTFTVLQYRSALYTYAFSVDGIFVSANTLVLLVVEIYAFLSSLGRVLKRIQEHLYLVMMKL